MSTGDDFRLSRIEAQGWNAARRVPLAALGQLDDTKIDALNPYQDGCEHLRWNTGFANALASWQR